MCFNGKQYSASEAREMLESMEDEIHVLRKRYKEASEKRDDSNGSSLDFIKDYTEELERGELEFIFLNNDDDVESLVYELEEQHKHDCNKIEELTTTIKTLSGIISDLKQ